MQEIPTNLSQNNNSTPPMQSWTPSYSKPTSKIKLPWLKIILGVVFIILIIIGLYFFIAKFSTSDLSYSDTYRLVPEKISQSAVIRISLPKGVDKELAKEGVVFEPKIEGDWVDNKSTTWLGVQNVLAATIGQKVNTNFILFQPSSPLALNRHYSVTVNLGEEKTLISDFLAVDNPQVISVFPRSDSEAPEDSKITIVFNRPMVPVTTLDELKEQSIPVGITPKTDGKFKWISTNTLQFIPKDTLHGSSNYTVKIKQGFVSMDGLKVSDFEGKFQTRNLRYGDGQNYSRVDGQIYDKPVRVYFNQPVNLNKTKGEIKLTDKTANREIPFIAEYAKLTEEEQANRPQYKRGDSFGGFGWNIFGSMYASILDFFGWGNNPEGDRSVIDIYPQKDKFGRSKFWDFANNYTININKAYPANGDIILNQAKIINVVTTDITGQLRAVSSRTNYASPTLFDPQGYLEVPFYEPINLSKSNIDADNMQKIEYGQKCRNGQNYNINNCEKAEDRTKVKIYFNSSAIRPGDTINIRLKKIVNDDGLQINKDVFSQSLSVYKPLQIKLGYLENSYYKDTHYLKGFYICSNNPLTVPEKKDLKKEVQANLDYQINSFAPSFLTYWADGKSHQCGQGEFSTWVSGGFMPNSDYQIKLDINDVFGQNAKNDISFATGAMSTENVDVFAMQQRYSITTPDKTILTFGSLNINYVNVQICKTSAMQLKQLYNENGFGDSGCDNYTSKIISLPEKYWINNYFDIDLSDYFSDPIGNYVIALTHPLLRDYKGNPKNITGYVTVTNLAVAEKAIAPATDYLGNDREFLTTEQIQSLKNLYWVTDIKTQNPVSGAQIKFYDKYGKVLGSTITNADGVALSAPAIGVDSIVASLDNDNTVVMRNNDKFMWTQSADNYRKAYIYTDKPLYRPEQTVHVKGILRIGYDGNYEMFNTSTAEIKGYNSKGTSILDKQVGIDNFGTFNFDFILDKDSPLGTYRICLGNSYINCTKFDILEYVPAAFQVSSKLDKQEYISKDTANIQINANYYFGAPVDNSRVDYTFSSQNYYFDKYKGNEWYSFGWWDDAYYDSRGYYYGDNFISRGSGTTDINGKLNISQKLDLQNMFKNSQNYGSKIIVLDTTVKNSLGQSVSNQQSFMVHAGQYYIGIKTDPYFVGKNQEFNLKVKTVDTNGNNVSEGGITADIYKVDWNYVKRQEVGGVFNYQYEKNTELAQSIKLSTNNNGDWSQKVKLGQEGEYEIQVSAYDKAGNLIKSKYNVYVFGSGAASFRPTNDTTLNLKANNTDLKVGDQGELIIESPYSKSKALISIERGKIFDYQIVDFTGNIEGYKFTAKEDYAPNVYISVLLQSPDPAVKFGMKEFKIDNEKSKINIDVKSDKKFYSPGEQVRLDITATDYKENPLKIDASVAVVDLSVLALKGNPKKDPLVFFYNGFPLTVSTASNIKNGIVKIEPAEKTKGGSGGGGGDESKTRGEFKETAFWQANVRTDSNGKTQVSFKLPDNLTTWQAEVLGVTQDTKLGVNYIDFMSRKDLMVVPLKPRFIVPGDTFYIGAQIFNQSDSNKNFKITFKSDTLEFKDNRKEKSINVGRGQSQSVFFQVKAPENINQGQHTFTISAEGGGLSDAVTQNIVIRPNLTYEVTASANYTQGNSARELIYLPANVTPNKGELTLRSSATLAVFLSNALNYLIGYPYGGSEQIASQLKAIAIVKTGLRIPNLADQFKLEKVQYRDQQYTADQLVDIGLGKLYSNQNYDGGFNFWSNGQSNYYATLSVVDSFNSLKKAGYSVSNDSLNKASDYLYNYYNQERSKMTDNDIIALASVLLETNSYAGNSNLINAVSSIASDTRKVQDKLSVKSLAELGVMVNSGQFGSYIVSQINNALDNRVNIDSRGAFLEPAKTNWYYSYFESSIGDTALYLDSLAVGKRDTAVTDKIIRWLLNSRDKDGAWGSTQNTLAVVNAFTDYLGWKKETNAVYTLNTNLNGKTIDTYSFNASTILDQNKKTVPMNSFNLDDYNFLELVKNGNGSLYYDMGLKYYLTGIVQPRDEGFSITRQFYSLDDKSGLNPLSQAKEGEVIREHLTIVAPVNRKYVQIEDYIPAGLEIVDLNLATEQKSLRLEETQVKAPQIYSDFKEIRDDRAYVYTDELLPGVYEFDYYVRALVPGKYLQLPAVVSEMYNPENFGRTSSSYFTVTK